jgi:hypothetical protein
MPEMIDLGSSNGFMAAAMGQSVDDTPLSPEDTPQEPAAPFVLRLRAKDQPFLQRGTVRIFVYGAWQNIPIHTVSEEELRNAINDSRPRQPSLRNHAGQLIVDDDELGRFFPEYKAALAEWNGCLGHLTILLGSDGLELEDDAGHQVWPFVGTERPWLHAVRALRTQKIGAGQFTTWFEAIQRLGSGGESAPESGIFLPSSAVN